VPNNLLCYAVMYNGHYTFILVNVSLYFVLQQIFFLHSSLFFFFPSSYALYHTFISECDCFPLQCLYEDCTQSNQELALSQLMQSLHCRSSIFSYDVRERRPAQEAVLSCVGMHSIKNSSH
jgi:hypothetical protein